MPNSLYPITLLWREYSNSSQWGPHPIFYIYSYEQIKWLTWSFFVVIMICHYQHPCQWTLILPQSACYLDAPYYPAHTPISQSPGISHTLALCSSFWKSGTCQLLLPALPPSLPSRFPKYISHHSLPIFAFVMQVSSAFCPTHLFPLFNTYLLLFPLAVTLPCRYVLMIQFLLLLSHPHFNSCTISLPEPPIPYLNSTHLFHALPEHLRWHPG